MRRSCVSSGVHHGLEEEDGRLVGVLEVMRCVILARQSSNHRSSERNGESRGSCKRKVGEQWGHVIPIRVLPLEALGRGLQERSGENDCEGGMIRSSLREGGVPGPEERYQGSVGKGQVKNCRAMIGREREPSVDPGCIEERKQLRRCSVKIRRTYNLIVIGKQTSRVGSGVVNVEVPKNKCRKIRRRKQINTRN